MRTFSSVSYILPTVYDLYPFKVTHPTEGVKIPAGQPFSITWQDDGKTPNLTAFGPATVGLYVGSPTQQVWSMRRFLVVLGLMIYRLNCN
jgi:hypothetical protein